MINAMLSNSSLNNSFWGEVFLSTCYILNRIPSKKTKVSPYELWKKKTNSSHFKVWGCQDIVRLPKIKIKKFGQKVIK